MAAAPRLPLRHRLRPLPPPPPPPASTTGTSGSDNWTGTAGDDIFDGLGSSDVLRGLGGNDTLKGGSGGDSLYGGAGNDILTGNGGRDTFYFDTAPGAGNLDRITDFTPGSDRVALENGIFTALGSAGTLSSSAFYRGAAAHDATDRIIYDSGTGHLFYDPDGTGAAAAMHIADLAAGLSLSASSFLVV